jgi:hypothetical protein
VYLPGHRRRRQICCSITSRTGAGIKSTRSGSASTLLHEYDLNVPSDIMGAARIHFMQVYVDESKSSLEGKAAVPEKWSEVIQTKASELERQLESHTNSMIRVVFTEDKLSDQDSGVVEKKLTNLQRQIVSYFEQQYQEKFDDVKV